MKKVCMTSFVMIAVLVFVLTGCSSKEENSAAEAAGEKQKNNKLVVYTAGPTGLAEELENAFEQNTGMTVEVFQGTTGKVLARLESEKANPVADVVILASLPAMEGLKEQGSLLAYKEAKGKEAINPEWSDKDGYFYGYSASALGIVYNTNNVKEAPKEWEDLTKPEWKGKIAIPDPSQSGSALDFLYGYTQGNPDAWKTIEAWKDNDLMLAGANKEALETVVTGSKDIVISGVDYMTYAAKADGEPVDVLYPESGTVVSPRPAGILKEAQNVEGAKQFIDFLLSNEGQQLVGDAYLLPGNENTPLKDRAPLKDIPTITFDWNDNEQQTTEIIEKFKEMYEQ